MNENYQEFVSEYLKTFVYASSEEIEYISPHLKIYNVRLPPS